MSMTIISAGQSLVDVALQELGSVAALFDLADAAGLAITDALTPGQQVPVPLSRSARPDVAAYFSGRAQRLNTGAPAAPDPAPRRRDFKPTDFSRPDFS